MQLGIERVAPQVAYSSDLLRLLPLGGQGRKKQAESENEPDQSHGHPGGGWLRGSLVERRDAHQHGAAPQQAPGDHDVAS